MSKGKLKITAIPKPQAKFTQSDVLISVRNEINEDSIMFSYENIKPASLVEDVVLYEEGTIPTVPGDISFTAIKVFSPVSKTIGSSSTGTFELVVQSAGTPTQLDKTLTIAIGDNTLTLLVDFESRPDTLDFTLTNTSYGVPIKITKQHVLDHFFDYDSSTLTHAGIECGVITNFKYNGSTYVSGQMLPLDTLDSLGLYYHPEENVLGYEVEFPWIVRDNKGLETID